MIKLFIDVMTYTKPPIKPPAIPAFLGKVSMLLVKNEVNYMPEQIWMKNAKNSNISKLCVKKLNNSIVTINVN